MMKNIGVLTSGGDAPGMNAAVRAVVRAAIHYGINVYGIEEGYYGLLNRKIRKLEYRDVSDIIAKGGTFLKSARCLEFATPEGVQKGVDVAREFGLDGLVVVGGDGSFRGAKDLSNAGLPTIGIPGTIDNDIACTDYTLGFDTALRTACDAIDMLKDTCYSHGRCSVVEVMGRHAGHIALHAGIAGGGESIILPEKDFDLTETIEGIKHGLAMGKTHFVVVLAEGITDASQVAKDIEAATGVETRATILGHTQRGGSPTVRDRVIATQMGVYAVELLMEGISNCVVAYKSEKLVHYEINEALAMKKSVDENLVEVFKKVTY